MGARVLVAMSGGVDSSVAAALLVAQGYEVVGVTLHLWDTPDDGSIKGRCCAPEDVHDARRVADRLRIPHYAFDRRQLFDREVVAPFVESYLGGTTPSPCVTCNRTVKLRELLVLADQLGAERVATGHYARVVDIEGQARLHRGRDPEKDQAYFLHMLRASDLARLLFPLGELTKAEVRSRALELELPGARKGESQELCFVPTGRYDALIAERAGDRLRGGPILDEAGRVLGRHEGVHAFTVGQRRNLGVAQGRRLYVVGLEPESASVILGPQEALLRRRALVKDVSLAEDVRLPRRADVAVRYRGKTMPSLLVSAGEGGVDVYFDAPVQAVVPGQVAVFYEGERVLGGGRIDQAEGGTES